MLVVHHVVCGVQLISHVQLRVVHSVLAKHTYLLARADWYRAVYAEMNVQVEDPTWM